LHLPQVYIKIITFDGMKIDRKLGLFSPDQHKCFAWCLDNGIEVYAVAKIGLKDYEIEIKMQDKLIKSPKRYHKSEISYKIWELYCHLYKENNPTV